MTFDDPQIVNSIKFFSVDDHPERDPAIITIAGKREEDGKWVLLTSEDGLKLNLPGKNEREQPYYGGDFNYSGDQFKNSDKYKTYAVQILETRGEGNSFQLSEVTFLHVE